MANSIKYSTTGDTQSLKKGNFFFGVGDVGKGPSSATTYYNGSTPSASGYTVYSFDASQPSRISYASPTSDSEFIGITNVKSGQNFTGVTQCLNWYVTQTDHVSVNRDYEPIVSNGLVLNLDAGFTPSYSTSGATWYDISYSGNNGTLVNGPTFSTIYGGAIVQDGTNDYISLPPSNNLTFTGNTSFSCELITQNKGFINANYPAILSFGEYDTSTAGGWLCTMYSVSGFGLINFVRSAGNALDAGGGVGYNFTSTADATSLNIWTYVYSSTSGGTLYRNGTSIVNTLTTGSVTSTSLTNYYIGRRGNLSSRVTNNNIFSVKIYNRALSASEVLQNYNAQKSRFGL